MCQLHLPQQWSNLRIPMVQLWYQVKFRLLVNFILIRLLTFYSFRFCAHSRPRIAGCHTGRDNPRWSAWLGLEHPHQTQKLTQRPVQELLLKRRTTASLILVCLGLNQDVYWTQVKQQILFYIPGQLSIVGRRGESVPLYSPMEWFAPLPFASLPLEEWEIPGINLNAAL